MFWPDQTRRLNNAAHFTKLVQRQNALLSYIAERIPASIGSSIPTKALLGALPDANDRTSKRYPYSTNRKKAQSITGLPLKG